jgi:hypothetical protein
MDTHRDNAAAEAHQLILEAATGTRDLSDDELQRVLEQVAQAGFFPAPNAKAGGRLAGLTWQGRTLTGRDRVPPAEVHYLAHVVVGQEWPLGTTLADYLDSIHGVILDPRSGVLTSRLYGEWQLAVVTRSGPLRGPQGYEWLMVEYRVSITSWATAHQLREGLSAITQSPNRQGVRWLRQPN